MILNRFLPVYLSQFCYIMHCKNLLSVTSDNKQIKALYASLVAGTLGIEAPPEITKHLLPEVHLPGHGKSNVMISQGTFMPFTETRNQSWTDQILSEKAPSCFAIGLAHCSKGEVPTVLDLLMDRGAKVSAVLQGEQVPMRKA